MKAGEAHCLQVIPHGKSRKCKRGETRQPQGWIECPNQMSHFGGVFMARFADLQSCAREGLASLHHRWVTVRLQVAASVAVFPSGLCWLRCSSLAQPEPAIAAQVFNGAQGQRTHPPARTLPQHLNLAHRPKLPAQCRYRHPGGGSGGERA